MKMIWRLFFLQNSRNNRTLDGLGFFHILYPFFREIADSDEELEEIVSRHVDYFNANPILAPYIVGVVMNLELRKKAGEDISAERISGVKNTLSSVLTAKGEYFFEIVLVPFALTIGCIFAIYNSYIGPVIFLIFYNLYHFQSRIGGYREGFFLGEDVGRTLAVTLFREQKWFSWVAAFVSGVFAALIIARAWSFGGFRFFLWGVLMVAALFLLCRKIAFLWAVSIIFMATAVFLAIW